VLQNRNGDPTITLQTEQKTNNSGGAGGH